MALTLLSAHWWSMALALSATIGLMLMTRTVHPPAGSNPLIIMLTLPHWDFLFVPTLLGAMLLVLIALVFNNLDKAKSYPKYWFQESAQRIIISVRLAIIINKGSKLNEKVLNQLAICLKVNKANRQASVALIKPIAKTKPIADFGAPKLSSLK